MLCSYSVAVYFIQVAVIFDWGVMYNLVLEAIILMTV